MTTLDLSRIMSQDPVKVAPEVYKVLLENDRVRVLEVRMKQGAKAEMHSHPDCVIHSLTDSKVKFTFPGGKSDSVDLKMGQTMWIDALSHSVENPGGSEAHVVLVELKK